MAVKEGDHRSKGQILFEDKKILGFALPPPADRQRDPPRRTARCAGGHHRDIEGNRRGGVYPLRRGRAGRTAARHRTVAAAGVTDGAAYPTVQ